MLLKIDYDPKDVIEQSDGRIVLKLHFFSAYAQGAHLCTVEGESARDFRINPVRRAKALFVGQNGGISLE